MTYLRNCTNVIAYVQFAQFLQLAPLAILSSFLPDLLIRASKCNLKQDLWLLSTFVTWSKFNIWSTLNFLSALYSFILETLLNRKADSAILKHTLHLMFSDVVFYLRPLRPISWTKSKIGRGASILKNLWYLYQYLRSRHHLLLLESSFFLL